MPIEKRELIPQPLKGEVRVTLVLPDEARLLLSDLHNDRQSIAWGGLVLLTCIVALCCKDVLRRPKV